MKNLQIAVGTTSKQKIGYLKEVLSELKVKAQIIPVKAKSGISEQPCSAQETKRGSNNRAKQSLKEVPGADFAMGIEVGCHKNTKAQYEMFCAVTIVDNDGHRVQSESHKLLLPKFYQNIINTNKQIWENLDGYLKGKKSKTHIDKHIDQIIRHRKPFIESALRIALIQYLNKEDFK